MKTVSNPMSPALSQIPTTEIPNDHDSGNEKTLHIISSPNSHAESDSSVDTSDEDGQGLFSFRSERCDIENNLNPTATYPSQIDLNVNPSRTEKSESRCEIEFEKPLVQNINNKDEDEMSRFTQELLSRSKLDLQRRRQKRLLNSSQTSLFFDGSDSYENRGTKSFNSSFNSDIVVENPFDKQELLEKYFYNAFAADDIPYSSDNGGEEVTQEKIEASNDFDDNESCIPSIAGANNHKNLTVDIENIDYPIGGSKKEFEEEHRLEQSTSLEFEYNENASNLNTAREDADNSRLNVLGVSAFEDLSGKNRRPVDALTFYDDSHILPLQDESIGAEELSTENDIDDARMNPNFPSDITLSYVMPLRDDDIESIGMNSNHQNLNQSSEGKQIPSRSSSMMQSEASITTLEYDTMFRRPRFSSSDKYDSSNFSVMSNISVRMAVFGNQQDQCCRERRGWVVFMILVATLVILISALFDEESKDSYELMVNSRPPSPSPSTIPSSSPTMEKTHRPTFHPTKGIEKSRMPLSNEPSIQENPPFVFPLLTFPPYTSPSPSYVIRNIFELNPKIDQVPSMATRAPSPQILQTIDPSVSTLSEYEYPMSLISDPPSTRYPSRDESSISNATLDDASNIGTSNLSPSVPNSPSETIAPVVTINVTNSFSSTPQRAPSSPEQFPTPVFSGFPVNQEETSSESMPNPPTRWTIIQGISAKKNGNSFDGTSKNIYQPFRGT